jgi:hypothetical protein
VKHSILAAVLLCTVGGCAVREKPVMQVQAAPINFNGGEATVENRIKSALAGRGWEIVAEQPNLIRAQYAKANSEVGAHSVTIDIPYDADSYSILYVDSQNMMYDPDAGTIHRNYNRWVANLQMDIDAPL